MKVYYLILLIALYSCKVEKEEAVNKYDEEIATVEGQSEQATDVSDIELEIHDYQSLKKYLEADDGKTYVVNFWATWCKPCIKELPYFEKLNAEYKDKNVEVILVSLDFPSKYESNLKPYIKENNLKSKVVALDDADSNTWIPKIDESWSGAIPATLIYNSEKRIFHEGSYNYEELENEIKPFLK